MKFSPSSILWRIFSYYTLLVATAITLLVTGHYWVEVRRAEQLAGMRMQALILRLIPFVLPPPRTGPDSGRPPRREEVESQRQRPELQQHLDALAKEGMFLCVTGGSADVDFRSANVPKDFQPPQRGPDGISRVVWGPYLVAQLQSPRNHQFVIGMPRSNLTSTLNKQLVWSIFVGLLVFVGASGTGYLILWRGLQPIDQISTTAQHIAAGDLSERINVRSQRSELGELARVLNETFSRLDDALQRQVRFTADASHELRTPVASIMADCQFSLKKPRSTERYLETINTCHENAQHMRGLIDRLGLLAKCDAHDALLEREPINVQELAEQSFGVMHPLAVEKGLTLRTTLQPGWVEADRLRLGQTVINLLNNALRYNRPDGWIWLRTGTANGWAFMEVEDSGVGIPADKLDKVFERFFRVDPSRNNRTGGSGLGLAICKSIVEAHGGKLTAQSEPNKGSLFRIELPLAKQRVENLA